MKYYCIKDKDIFFDLTEVKCVNIRKYNSADADKRYNLIIHFKNTEDHVSCTFDTKSLAQVEFAQILSAIKYI